MKDLREKSHDVIELLVICLETREAKIVSAQSTDTLDNAVHEHYSEFYRRIEGSLVAYDVNRIRNLAPSEQLSSLGLTDHNIVLIGDREEMRYRLGEFAFHKLPKTATVESFKEALSIASRFRHTGCSPEAITCHLGEEEFASILSYAVHGDNRSSENDRFGYAKLLMDSIISADKAYFNNTTRLADALREILVDVGEQQMDETRDSAIQPFLSQVILAQCRPPEKRLRLICNAAAMHVEPAPYHPVSLIELVKDGQLRIGEISVESHQEVIAREIVMSETESSYDSEVSAEAACQGGSEVEVEESEAMDIDDATSSTKKKRKPRDTRSRDDEDDEGELGIVRI
jgi:hypothetical protein